MSAGATLPSRGHILVADDEPHIRRILATLLESAGYTVRQACDGREALDALDSPQPPDVFLLDLMMPEASGMDVLDSIRSHPHHRHTPVIILTAKGQDADRDAALEAGADDFVTKPFSPRKLLSRIQEILSAR
ncbi:MAG: response regulator [Gemmatimonadetes bacterium]|nr:response regulator [Gemmatimonadota bacterium]